MVSKPVDLMQEARPEQPVEHEEVRSPPVVPEQEGPAVVVQDAGKPKKRRRSKKGAAPARRSAAGGSESTGADPESATPQSSKKGGKDHAAPAPEEMVAAPLPDTGAAEPKKDAEIPVTVMLPEPPLPPDYALEQGPREIFLPKENAGMMPRGPADEVPEGMLPEPSARAPTCRIRQHPPGMRAAYGQDCRIRLFFRLFLMHRPVPHRKPRCTPFRQERTLPEHPLLAPGKNPYGCMRLSS